MVDEHLQEEGKKLKGTATDSIQLLLTDFGKVSAPGVEIFTEKMQDLILIYNYTDEIYFDNNNMYLCSERYQNDAQ